MINQLFELHTILFTALNDIDEIIFQEEDSVYKLLDTLKLNQA